MRTQLVMKWIPGLLATTLVAVACDKPPNPAAPKRPQFSVHDEQNSRITGGGKLDGGRDFATFGFNARFDQGQIEWVQHCLDGVDAMSDDCASGSFTFHGSSVTDYGVAATDPEHCRAWSGDGEAKFKDQASPDGTFHFTATACDSGEPSRGTDFICFDIVNDVDAYHREGLLKGGNIQLHKGTPGPAANDCVVVTTVPT